MDPGVIDVSTAMFGQIPHFLAKMIDAGEQERFDKDMEHARARGSLIYLSRRLGWTLTPAC